MELTKEQFYLRRIAELENQNAELREQNAQLVAQVARLAEQVVRLSKNSSNSFNLIYSTGRAGGIGMI